MKQGRLDDENKHYIGIIKRNTDRLINIINDLLSLSEMEEKGIKLQLRHINLKDIIEQALVVFEQQLQSKGFYSTLYRS